MKKFFIFISIILFVNIYAEDDEIKEIKEKVKKIEEGIEKNKTRIIQAKRTEEETLKLIKDMDEEIEKKEKEYYELQDEYNSLNKNIDYGEKNLKIIDSEIIKNKKKYSEVFLFWEKYGFSLKNNYFITGEDYNDYQNKKDNLKFILENYQNKIKEIFDLREKLIVNKMEIQEEKTKLYKLRLKIAENKKNIAQAKNKKEQYVKTLKNKQNYYKSQISSLKKKKESAEKEIEKILEMRSKKTGIVSREFAIKEIGRLLFPLKTGKVILGYGKDKVGDVKSNGIEIQSTLGQRVLASNNGTVIFAEKFDNLGKVVMIEHGYNLVSIYGNLISINVKNKDFVKKGDIIGVLGLSSEKKPILYYEIRFNMKTYDPYKFLEE